MTTPTIAFVYPGQGSLRAGMGSTWADHDPAGILATFGAAAGVDLVAAADDPDSGARTAIAQPAIAAVSLAADRALRAAGITPALVAGHSLGEVTAAIAAGVVAVEQGAALVAARGGAMGEACAAEPGAMAAILKLPDEVVERLVASVEGAAVANVNAPGQVVVSGTPEAVDAVVARAREAGGRVMALAVEGAFHSPAMAPAMVAFDRVLNTVEVRHPTVPVVTGTSGAALTRGEDVARALVEGILAPVRWNRVQTQMADRGVDLVVEVGPGGVLAGLAKRSIPDIPVVTVAAPGDVPLVAEKLAERELATVR